MDKHPKTQVPDKPTAHQQKLQQAAIHLTNTGNRKAMTNTQEVMRKPERWLKLDKHVQTHTHREGWQAKPQLNQRHINEELLQSCQIHQPKQFFAPHTQCQSSQPQQPNLQLTRRCSDRFLKLLNEKGTWAKPPLFVLKTPNPPSTANAPPAQGFDFTMTPAAAAHTLHPSTQAGSHILGEKPSFCIMLSCATCRKLQQAC